MRSSLLFLSVLLVISLPSCQKETASPDLLLGHWQSEQSFWELRTTAGQRYARFDFRPDTLTLDVTTTTLTFRRGTSVVQQLTYSRVGEVLTLPEHPEYKLQYIRELTTTTFTSNSTSLVGPAYGTFVGRDYHR